MKDVIIACDFSSQEELFGDIVVEEKICEK